MSVWALGFSLHRDRRIRRLVWLRCLRTFYTSAFSQMNTFLVDPLLEFPDFFLVLVVYNCANLSTDCVVGGWGWGRVCVTHQNLPRCLS